MIFFRHLTVQELSLLGERRKVNVHVKEKKFPKLHNGQLEYLFAICSKWKLNLQYLYFGLPLKLYDDVFEVKWQHL